MSESFESLSEKDISFLKGQSFFGGLSEEALKNLIPLFKLDRFEKGADIIKEGELGDSLFIIFKGSVDVLKQVNRKDSDKMRLLAHLTVGDTFGEMELIDVQERVATVRASEDTVVLRLTNADLYKITKQNMQTFAVIIMNLAREISRRLREMDRLVASSEE